MAVTITEAIATASTTNATTYATGSFTPVANDLLIALVTVSGNIQVPTMTDSQNLGWDYVGSAFYATNANCVHIFVANTPAAASSMTATFSCVGATASGAVVNIVRVAGMIKYGSFAIRQWAAASNNTAGSTTAVVFANTTLTTNPILGAIGNSTNAATMTPPTSYTELVDTGYATPTTGHESAYIISGITATTITWGSNSASVWGGVVIELDASTTGWTIIQSKQVAKTVGTGTTGTVALRTTTTGSMLVAGATTDAGSANSITGIAATGTSWAGNKKVDINDGGGASELAWYSFNTSSSATPTLTVTFAASTIGTVFINEYVYYNAGTIVAITSDPFDQLKSAIGGASTAPNSGATPTLTGTTDLVVAGAGTLDSANTYKPGAAYGGAIGVKNGTTLDTGIEDAVASGTGGVTGAFTISASDFWGCWVLAFQAPPTGTLHTQSLSGTFSASGTLEKTTNYPLAGTFHASGALTRFLTRTLTGTFSASGALTWLLTRLLPGGTFSASGALTGSRLHFHSDTSTFSASGVLIKQTNKSLGGTYKTSGVLSRFATRTLSGTFSASGTLKKAATRALSGTFSASGTLIRLVKRTLAGTFSASGILNKSSNRKLTGTFKGSGVLTKTDQRQLSGIFKASGSLSSALIHVTLVTLTSTFVATGNLIKRTNRTFTSTFIATGFFQVFIAPIWTFITASLSSPTEGRDLTSPVETADLDSSSTSKLLNSPTENSTIQSEDPEATLTSGTGEANL